MQYSRRSFSVPDLTPPPAPIQSRHGLEAGFQNASRCRGPGCGAIGKAMLEGYCDKCYVKEQSARFNQVAQRSSHSPPPVVVGPPRSPYALVLSFGFPANFASQTVSSLLTLLVKQSPPC